MVVAPAKVGENPTCRGGETPALLLHRLCRKIPSTPVRRREHSMEPKNMTKRAHVGHDSRIGRRGEARFPAAVAVVVAAALYALLPEPLLLGPRLLIPVLEAALLVAVLLVRPRRLTAETWVSRVVSMTLAAVIAVTNIVALGLLVAQLVQNEDTPGGSLLLGALQVWATNVIAFALIFWELDRGGPVARTQLERNELPLADFRFTHDEDHDTVVEVAEGSSKTADWVPTFLDYLYVSTTNSSAFSPTDTMPLSNRAKALMGIEATAALLTSLIVVSRAIGALG
jgi:hypothetical protein